VKYIILKRLQGFIIFKLSLSDSLKNHRKAFPAAISRPKLPVESHRTKASLDELTVSWERIMGNNQKRSETQGKCTI
jgi:hypothetical protein